jgi:hypothetical protein
LAGPASAFHRGRSGGYHACRFADHGATWTWCPWRFTESFGCPTFLNFGRDYAGARDGSVYVVSPDSAYIPAEGFVLARVPQAALRERAAYEFFVRLDGAGVPVWSRATFAPAVWV